MTIALSVLLVLATAGLVTLAVMLVSLRKKATQIAAQFKSEEAQFKAKYEHDMGQWRNYAAGMKAANERLSKYQGIVDADAKAAELLAQGQSILDKARRDAEAMMLEARRNAKSLEDEAQRGKERNLADAEAKAAELLEAARASLEKATRESDEMLSGARSKAKQLKEQAESLLSSATTQSSGILASAHKRAEEIAGDAYRAMGNAALYEQAVKAMGNIIDGYGDQYLVPSHSLLDDLADDFAHTQAGVELKRCRERTRLMIRNGTAARCEYVETNRRETAINFVTDAFNGKVDSVLSRVKHDNAGTLKQEIRDAFILVNFNGKAFREARINEEFLAARLDELKWAAIAQQMKLEEREEQRHIREQIREEEKVRRECERAMREAARDEDSLRRAMEKAQQLMEQANAEQRAKYELQLQDLALKLKAAEDRSQRAMSMAQQTRQGHVYIISNVGSFGEHVYKIGLTRRLEPLDRVRELGDSSVPFAFDVHALIPSDDAPTLESKLHNHFVLMQMNKVNHRKEFFRLDLKQIREEVEAMGIAPRWTMTAEAREYRESLAIEEAIKSDPAKRDAWIARQLEIELLDDISAEEELDEKAPMEDLPEELEEARMSSVGTGESA